MVSCPHCGAQIDDDDYGMTQCGSCNNFVMIDMDGQVVDPNQQDSFEVSDENQGNSEVSSIESLSDRGVSNELQSIEVPEDMSSPDLQIGNNTSGGASDVNDVDPGVEGIFEYMGENPTEDSGQPNEESSDSPVSDVFDYADQVASDDTGEEESVDFSSQGEDQEGESDFLQSGEAVEQGEYQSPIDDGDSSEVEEDNSQFFEADDAEEQPADYQMSDDQAVVENAEDNHEEEPAEDYQEESQHETDGNEDGFESPMDSFFEDGTDGTESQNDPENPDPNDPLGISGFANSEESQGLDGPYLYRVLVKGIDSKEIRENLREVLEDSKFGWSVEELMPAIKSGELLIEGLNPIKAYMLIISLRTLPVEVSWKQSGIVSVEV